MLFDVQKVAQHPLGHLQEIIWADIKSVVSKETGTVTVSEPLSGTARGLKDFPYKLSL